MRAYQGLYGKVGKKNHAFQIFIELKHEKELNTCITKKIKDKLIFGQYKYYMHLKYQVKRNLWRQS